VGRGEGKGVLLAALIPEREGARKAIVDVRKFGSLPFV